MHVIRPQLHVCAVYKLFLTYRFKLYIFSVCFVDWPNILYSLLYIDRTNRKYIFKYSDIINIILYYIVTVSVLVAHNPTD